MKKFSSILLIFLVLALAASSVKLLSNNKNSVTPLHKNEVNVGTNGGNNTGNNDGSNDDLNVQALEAIRAEAISLGLSYTTKHFLAFEEDAVTTGLSWDNSTGHFICTKNNEGGGAFASIPNNLRKSKLVVEVVDDSSEIALSRVKVDLNNSDYSLGEYYYLSDFTSYEPYYDENGIGIAGSEHMEGGRLIVDLSSLSFDPSEIYVQNLGWDDEDNMFGDIELFVYFEVANQITNESTYEQIAFAIESCSSTLDVSEGLLYSIETKDEISVAYVSGLGSCTDRLLVIPTTYQSYPVVGVKENAFLSNSNILAVVFLGNLEIVKSQAFGECFNLSIVKVFGTIGEVGSLAFASCNLRSFNCDGITGDIRDGAFENNPNLTELPCDINQCGRIYSRAFAGTGIEKLCLESSAYRFVGAGTFSSCEKLKEVELIGIDIDLHDSLFSYCTALETVIFSSGGGITEIGLSAFSGCNNIKNVYWRGNVASWSSIVFADCLSNPLRYGAKLYCSLSPDSLPYELIETLPEGIKISAYAFYGYQHFNDEKIFSGKQGDQCFAFSNIKMVTACGTNEGEWTFEHFKGCEDLILIEVGVPSLDDDGDYVPYELEPWGAPRNDCVVEYYT